MGSVTPLRTQEHEYLSLYNRYRPTRFDEIRGQDAVAEPLRTSIVRGSTPRLNLFVGRHGTGKTSMARILAMALNCSHVGADGEPCGQCVSCRHMALGSTTDGLVSVDAASYGGVDRIREVIDATTLASATTPNKVILIDEVHGLSDAASQALLKTIEEPPSGVYFILCTTESHKVLPTIKSRATEWVFRPLSETILTDLVTEAIDAEAPDRSGDLVRVVPDIVAEAQGSARTAYSVLERVLDGGQVQSGEHVFDILAAVVAHDVPRLFCTTQAVVDAGMSPATVSERVCEVVRQSLIGLRASDMLDVTESTRERLTGYGEALGQSGLIRLATVIADANRSMGRQSLTEGRFLLESALLSFMEPTDDSRTGQILESVDALTELVESLSSRVDNMSRMVSSLHTSEGLSWGRGETPEKPAAETSSDAAMSQTDIMAHLKSLSSHTEQEESETSSHNLADKLALAAQQAGDTPGDDSDRQSRDEVPDADTLAARWDDFANRAAKRDDALSDIVNDLELAGESDQLWDREAVVTVQLKPGAQKLSNKETSLLDTQWKKVCEARLDILQ